MATNCIFDPTRKSFGFHESTLNRLGLGKSGVTRGAFTNIVRNLGLDDIRMINLRDADGKRFFGSNITDVSNLDLTKTPLSVNTVVRVPTAQGEKFFMTNKNGVTIPPSRWELDAVNHKIVPNPDWDAINVNVTGMRKYKYDDDGFWRVADEGEGGTYLNVQNPARHDAEISELIEKGYDAVEVDGRFRLINPDSQVIKPATISEKRVREAINKTVSEATPNENEVHQRLLEFGIPTKVATTIAGGVVGNLADEYDEHNGMFWGGALGLAMGSKNVRGAVSGSYKKATRAGDRDKLQEAIRSATEIERDVVRIEFAQRHGFKGDPSDINEVDKFLRTEKYINDGKLAGDPNWFARMFKNPVFESGQGLLTSIGASGKELFSIIREFEGAPLAMYSRLQHIQAQTFTPDVIERLGVRGTKEAFRKVQTNFIRSIPTYKNLSDEQAYQAFGDAVRRIVTTKASIDDAGKFVFDESYLPSQQIYRDPMVRETDRLLLQNEDAMMAVTSMRRFYKAQYDETISVLRAKYDKDLSNIPDLDTQRLINSIDQSGLSVKQWKSANPDRAKDFEKALAGPHKATVDRIKNVLDDLRRFQALEDRYIPQKWSSVKEAQAKSQWQASTNQQGTREQIDQAWELEKTRRVSNVNTGKYRYLDITDDGVDLDTRYFDSYSSAKAEFESILKELDGPQRARVNEYLRSGIDAEGHFIKGDATKGYFLDTPQALRSEFPEGVYGRSNADIIATNNRNFTTFNILKKADFLDRPRKSYIPSEFVELDMENLARHYSEDMGIRLHAIKNDLYNTADFNQSWGRRITNEAQGKIQEDDLSIRMDNIRSWLNVMQGQRGERKIVTDPKELPTLRNQTIADAKNDSFWNSFAKLVTFPFNYGTTLYSPFTPLVLGPYIASWKGVLGQYKRGFLAPKQYRDEMKFMVDELERMGVIERRFENYRTQYQNQYREELLGDRSSWRRRFADFSDKATDFSANFSLTKLAGRDPENLGLLRLFSGSMLDVSGFEAALMTRATFRHIDDLMVAYKGLDTSAEVMLGRTRHSRQTLAKEFSDLGITDMDGFVRRAGDFDNQFEGFQQYITGKGSIDNFTSDFYADMTKIINTTVDQYHARGKLPRPLKWVDNVWGRALSRYSVYAQNFGVQTTGQRIYRPIADWSANLGERGADVPMYKLMYYANTGNKKKFQEIFGNELGAKAYEDFPVEVVNNFLKVFAALGVGKAMMVTRGGMLDLTGIAVNEALGNEDYEKWRNVNRQAKLGNYADTGEPFYITDVFDGDVQGYDLFKAFLQMFHLTAGLGFGGRYTQVLTGDLQFPDGGVMEMTPVTGAPNDFYRRAGKFIYQTPIEDKPERLARELLDVLMLRATPVGTFFDARKGIERGVFGTGPSQIKTSIVDSVTGNPMDVVARDF